MEKKELRPIYQRETKFAVPIQNNFCPEPLPLAEVFELVKSEKEKIEMVEIEKLARLRTLFLHTFRNSIILNQGLMDWHFTNSTRVINQIKMSQLRRPNSGFTANNLVDHILGSIKKEEIK
jgi:hypothetical protein